MSELTSTGLQTAKQFGHNGVEFINDTETHTVNGYFLSFIEDTVIEEIDGHNITGNLVVGETFPAGYDLPIELTSIKLTSGACFVYKA